jgi:Fibronectin type III domain
LVAGLRSMLIAGMALGVGSVSGCGGGSGSASASAAGVIDRPATTGLTQTRPAAGQPSSGTSTGSSSSTLTLSWQAPTENSDGSALTDLKGYRIHYGLKSESYSDTIDVTNPGLTTYVVQNLPAGTYYVSLTAYNSKGDESTLSGEVSTQVD